MQRRWIVWKWTWNGKKWDKPPYQTNGLFAKSDDPATWCDYDEAKQAVDAGLFDGVGLCLHTLPSELLTAIDADDVRDPVTTALLPWVTDLINNCASYCEVTPSGRGIRILLLSDIQTIHTSGPHPGGGKFELFANCKRYITVSGAQLTVYDDLEDATDEVRGLEQILAHRMPGGNGNGAVGGASAGTLDRSAEFFRVVRTLKESGLTLAQAIAAFEAGESKYRGRLSVELPRAWDKFNVRPGVGSGVGGGQTSHEQVRKTYRPVVTIPDGALISVRPWIARGYLMRGCLTIPFGPPDQGKSLLLIHWAISLVTGRKVNAHQRFDAIEPRRVILVMAEDPENEQDMRLDAAMQAFNVTRQMVEPNMLRLMVDDDATMLTWDENKSQIICGPAWDELCEHVTTFKPDVVMLDPLIEFHTIPENNNERMRAVAGRFRWLARAHNLATVASSHTPKGDIAPGDLSKIRGAGSVGAASRFASTFMEMNDKEAQTFGITQRQFYCRLDRARGSYAPPASDAEWFEKHGFQIANGEQAPALIPWAPPQASIPGPQAPLWATLVAGIAAGCPVAGGGVVPWTAAKNAKRTDARHISKLFEQHGIERVSEAVTLDTLKNDHGITDSKVKLGRHERTGLRTALNLPEAEWLD